MQPYSYASNYCGSCPPNPPPCPSRPAYVPCNYVPPQPKKNPKNKKNKKSKK